MTAEPFVQVNTDSPLAQSRRIGYIVRGSGCWEWAGAKNDGGYGIWTRNGKRLRAHRLMYEQAKGPVPQGLQLDHLCRNRACVNPDHLEPVTCKENLRRGINARSAQTHCVNGHPFDEANTYRSPRGGRECKLCRREIDRKRNLRPERQATVRACGFRYRARKRGMA